VRCLGSRAGRARRVKPARPLLGLRTPLMPRFAPYPTGTVAGLGACLSPGARQRVGAAQGIG